MGAAFERAGILFDQRRYDRAAAELRRHLAAEPSDPEALALLSLCLTEREDLRGAWDAAVGAVNAAPEAPKAHYAVAFTLCRCACKWSSDGGFFHRRVQLTMAQQAVAEAIRLSPHADYFHLLAWILHQRLGPRPALAVLADGLRLDPSHVFCLELRSELLREVGDRGAASETLNAALALDPESPTMLLTRGSELLEASQPAEANEHFTAALRRDPNLEEAREGRLEAWKSGFWVYRLLALPNLRFVPYSALVLATLAASVAALLAIEITFASRKSHAFDSDRRAFGSAMAGMAAVVAIYLACAGVFEFLAQFSRSVRHALNWDRRFWANVQFGIVLWAAAVCAVAVAAGITGRYVHWPVRAGFLIPSAALAGALLSANHDWPYRRWVKTCVIAGAFATLVAGAALLTLGHLTPEAIAAGLMLLHFSVGPVIVFFMLLLPLSNSHGQRMMRFVP